MIKQSIYLLLLTTCHSRTNFNSREILWSIYFPMLFSIQNTGYCSINILLLVLLKRFLEKYFTKWVNAYSHLFGLDDSLLFPVCFMMLDAEMTRPGAGSHGALCTFSKAWRQGASVIISEGRQLILWQTWIHSITSAAPVTTFSSVMKFSKNWPYMYMFILQDLLYIIPAQVRCTRWMWCNGLSVLFLLSLSSYPKQTYGNIN